MPTHTHIPAPRNTIETYSSRPEREPPRNENGEIVCQHPSCQGKTEIFRRPCEWNKHMDKHERPYKCSEPTCEQNPGFTYSGGLLRHMREVHKKGVGPARKPLYCPHANCIRSTGEGFTRRENLEEHLRRRHSYTGHYSPPPDSHPSNQEESPDQPRKRRKTVDPDSPNGEPVQQQSQYPPLSDSRRESIRSELVNVIDDRLQTNGNDHELTKEDAIRQLALARQTVAQQQDLIRRQDEELRRLDGFIRNLPHDPSGQQNEELRRLYGFIENSPSGQNPSDQAVETGSTAPAVAAASPSAPIRVDATAPAPYTNGLVHATNSAQDADVSDVQAKSENDGRAASVGNEPSRRIEIGRDLVSERLASQAI